MMIRKITIFLSFSIFFVSMARGEAPSFKEYSDSQRMFSIQIPSDWTAGPYAGLDLMESPDLKDKQTLTVSMLLLIKEQKVEERFDQLVKGIQEEGLNIKGKGKGKIGSRKTMWVLYAEQKAQPETHLQYLLVEGKRYYVITAKTAAETFPQHEASLRKIIEGIQIQ